MAVPWVLFEVMMTDGQWAMCQCVAVNCVDVEREISKEGSKDKYRQGRLIDGRIDSDEESPE